MILDERSSTNYTAFDLGRGLVLQLLEVGGNPVLFERLWDLRKNSDLDHISDAFSNDLWAILRLALANEKKAVLVIDGLDEMYGAGSQAPILLSCLADVENEVRTGGAYFRCIVTSRTPQYSLPAA
jgi:hypothetical protein